MSDADERTIGQLKDRVVEQGPSFGAGARTELRSGSLRTVGRV
jgi:hypothetical protein